MHVTITWHRCNKMYPFKSLQFIFILSMYVCVLMLPLSSISYIVFEIEQKHTWILQIDGQIMLSFKLNWSLSRSLLTDITRNLLIGDSRLSGESICIGAIFVQNLLVYRIQHYLVPKIRKHRLTYTSNSKPILLFS